MQAAPISKPKRSQVVAVAPARASVQPKVVKEDLNSLKRAQLLTTEKNIEISGNPHLISLFLMRSRMIICSKF